MSRALSVTRGETRGATRAALLSLLLVAGCPAPDPNQGLGTGTPDQLLDYNQFVCTVQPVLIRRCSYLACHGNPDHALRIFSPGKLRALDTGKRDDRDARLTAPEVELNFESASGMVLGASAAARAASDPQQVLLLGKPLARRAGGAEHHGVGIFPVYPVQQIDDDLEFAALASWVGGAVQPQPVDADCANLFMLMGLTPRPR